MKHILLLFLALFLSSSLSAQNTATDDGGRWELGADLYAAFFGGKKLYAIGHDDYIAPQQVISELPIFKHLVLVKFRVNERLKMRSRLGISFEELKNRSNLIPNNDVMSGGPFGAFFSLGIERQIKLRRRVTSFLGCEAFGYHFQSKFRDETNDVGGFGYTSRIYDDRYKDQQYGLRPVFGINFRLFDHLFLSTETSISLAYRKQYKHFEEIRDQSLYASGGRTIKRFLFSIEPVSAIQLLYQF